jgi:hypothetical protein
MVSECVHGDLFDSARARRLIVLALTKFWRNTYKYTSNLRLVYRSEAVVVGFAIVVVW